MTEKNIQYWKNGLMFKLVDRYEAEEIKKQAVKDGFEVFDNKTYFSVEAKKIDKRRR